MSDPRKSKRLIITIAVFLVLVVLVLNAQRLRIRFHEYNLSLGPNYILPKGGSYKALGDIGEPAIPTLIKRVEAFEGRGKSKPSLMQLLKMGPKGHEALEKLAEENQSNRLSGIIYNNLLISTHKKEYLPFLAGSINFEDATSCRSNLFSMVSYTQFTDYLALAGELTPEVGIRLIEEFDTWWSQNGEYLKWNEEYNNFFISIPKEAIATELHFLQNGVTAHRGDSAAYPENTVWAFGSALRLGVDWIELDVHRTWDDKLVIIHDASTKAVAEYEVAVDKTEYSELRKIDVSPIVIHLS